MPVAVVPASPSELAPWRDLHRHELHGQVLKDSIPDRPGWTEAHILAVDGARVGDGIVAISGPSSPHTGPRLPAPPRERANPVAATPDLGKEVKKSLTRECGRLM
ncbi:MAG: hypothetical protein KatS3mg108_0182 [Isosphaeraceae bacterium]|jgi:hypothetical protein|nr:MAG: hypothetical protein KatS3mg108_0182 [Isosphaeraceae bacterium]